MSDIWYTARKEVVTHKLRTTVLRAIQPKQNKNSCLKTLTVHSTEALYDWLTGWVFCLDKGSGSLVVQFTSSPVSLGQEFSSQSPRFPKRPRGQNFRESVNLSGRWETTQCSAYQCWWPSVLLRRGQRGIFLLSKISGSRWASENMFGNFILWKTLCEASAVSVCF